MDQETLAEMFAEQAEWREQKAAEYPDDTRNIDAARHLRMLAQSASAVDQSLITAAEELHEDAPDSEEWSEMLKGAGFSIFPQSAEEFLREFIKRRSSGR